MIHIFTNTLGWALIDKKVRPSVGSELLGAELGGCGMLMENLSRWIDKGLQ